MVTINLESNFQSSHFVTNFLNIKIFWVRIVVKKFAFTKIGLVMDFVMI